MQVKVIEKNAVFVFDKQGVIIITDIEKKGNIVIGELVYDGKNVAILNRNNREFFSLKNIAPIMREKVKQSKYVTVIEKDNDNIYSYKVEVHLKDDLGFEDDFDEFAQRVVSELKEKMTPEDFDDFVKASEKFFQDA
jgi:hypothetical protein